MFVWLRLEPNGYVFVSLLSISENSEESKKWRIIRKPPAAATRRALKELFLEQYQSSRKPPAVATRCALGGLFLEQYQSSRKALESFSLFLAKHKGVYDYLYINSLGIYQDIVSPPARTQGEGTGQKEAAMGFISGHPKYTVIVAKEPTGSGWVLVSLVSRASAARLRAKLSGLKKTGGGIRWKPIDVPHRAQICMDSSVVFYKVIKLRKPEGDKAAYTFEFKANRSEAYIRFPHVFRSCKKLIGFVERVNVFRLKKWIRAEVK
jgi:hypothetical protein